MIHFLKSTKLELVHTPLPYEAAHKAHIDIFWDQVYEANPRLWNGVFFMFSDVKVENGVLSGKGHKTDFATFMYWRENGREASVTHITGTTFPILNDGSLLGVEMANHTANAGRMYFPAGSFDRADIVEGRFDITTNFTREIQEEIGIALKANWIQRQLLAVEAQGTIHITRPVNLPYSFSQVQGKWQQHLKNGGDDEITSLVQIKSAMHIPDQMPEYARILCGFHFGQAAVKAI